ncbi:myosin a tail domain interacting protein mtip [Theileria orientalis strain Shintoku]|uniref:Myosin a tail domain interacting protein mtip n=1 Tax=Theileria orientalis strain Shintoku TaxID=869250 RepID=J4DNI8_THEOR|nr:myosin a tail domain interacting protein mtip [Theileria orientalis strain Shintoku]BAM39034.1 myosin a tail domain interacting protein mtip [Theileria orientalis strain Shintoku]|eukprot:XP_009689335.1 myosin a tail domain interacting protein mtip [Theileria orientalis strain Shintoku]
MIVNSCLHDCYEGLPQPEFVLAPEDTELNYFLWMPGFKYKPSFQEKLTTLKSLSSNSDSTLDGVLEDLIEVDELENSFMNKAKRGTLDTNMAGALARELGGAPSQADLLEFEATFGNNVNFEQFKEFLAVSMYSYENRGYFEEMLAKFENTSGGMTVAKFENMLKNYGEPMTDKELGEVYKLLNVSNNTVWTKDLLNLLRPES